MAASDPGQPTPMRSPAPEDAERRQHQPDRELYRLFRNAGQRPVCEEACTRHGEHPAAAPPIASGRLPCALPIVRTMKTTSTPSRKTL
jgi:hypothetical protein